MNIYEKEKIEIIFTDFKNNVLPQIRTAIEGREKKSVVSALDGRVQAIEALIGNASAADSDNIINKVVEMIDFFSGITESDTIASLLQNVRSDIMGEFSSYYTKTQVDNLLNGLQAAPTVVNGRLIFPAHANVEVSGGRLILAQ